MAAKSGCCGSTDHLEDAAILFDDAGKKYKIASQWSKAGKIPYMLEASLYLLITCVDAVQHCLLIKVQNCMKS